MSSSSKDSVGSRHASKEALSAGIASVFSTFITYPLDLVRTHFQANDGKRMNLSYYGNTKMALKEILKANGIRGLYSGLNLAIIGASSAWGIYIFVYSKLKERLNAYGFEGVSQSMIAGTGSGIVTAILTNPIWVIKTRFQLQFVDKYERYNGIIDSVYKMAKYEKFSSFWKGLVPSLIGSYHGAVQLTIYEIIRNFCTNRSKDGKFGDVESFIAGGASKAVALFSTQPLSVIKVRLHKQRNNIKESSIYSGTVDCIFKIFREEGIKGFYKGTIPAMWRLSIHSALFFLFYERLRVKITNKL